MNWVVISNSQIYTPGIWISWNSEPSPNFFGYSSHLTKSRIFNKIQVSKYAIVLFQFFDCQLYLQPILHQNCSNLIYFNIIFTLFFAISLLSNFCWLDLYTIGAKDPDFDPKHWSCLQVWIYLLTFFTLSTKLNMFP